MSLKNYLEHVHQCVLVYDKISSPCFVCQQPSIVNFSCNSCSNRYDCCANCITLINNYLSPSELLWILKKHLSVGSINTDLPFVYHEGEFQRHCPAAAEIMSVFVSRKNIIMKDGDFTGKEIKEFCRHHYASGNKDYDFTGFSTRDKSDNMMKIARFKINVLKEKKNWCRRLAKHAEIKKLLACLSTYLCENLVPEILKNVALVKTDKFKKIDFSEVCLPTEIQKYFNFNRNSVLSFLTQLSSAENLIDFVVNLGDMTKLTPLVPIVELNHVLPDTKNLHPAHAVMEEGQAVIPIQSKKSPLSKKLRTMVWDQYIGKDFRQGPCYSCQTKIELTDFDCGHVIATKNGGSDEINNLRPLCRPCNQSCGSQNLEEFKKSLSLQYAQHQIMTVSASTPESTKSTVSALPIKITPLSKHAATILKVMPACIFTGCTDPEQITAAYLQPAPVSTENSEFQSVKNGLTIKKDLLPWFEDHLFSVSEDGTILKTPKIKLHCHDLKGVNKLNSDYYDVRKCTNKFWDHHRECYESKN